MGIYHRIRHMAVAAACVSGLAAGAAAALPGTALAINCKSTTGSGSTLQTKAQELWATNWKTAGSPSCANGAVTIEYNKPSGTGSGQGLEEFGMTGKKLGLLPKKSSNGTTLDAFIGTDDPPTEALLLEGKEASGAWTLTVPVTAAPVAAIVHLPETGCTITAEPAEIKVSQALINEVWKGKVSKWSELLPKLGYTITAGTCESEIKHEVRSDSSGTSYAWKYWMCQIEGGGAPPCATWEEKAEILTDAAVWPAGTKAITEYEAGKPNKGNGGEIKAVEHTAGSIGYVNYANAKTEGGFAKYAAAAKKYWLKLENGFGGVGKQYAEPGAGCPTTLTAVQEGTLPKVEAGKDTAIWSKFHLSSTVVNATGTYAGCTLTYDVAWENYLTAKLEEAGNYGKNPLADEIGETAKQYLKWITLETGGQKTTNLAEGYYKLPTVVRETAEKTVALITP